MTESHDVIIIASGAGGELKKVLNHTGMAEHRVLRKKLLHGHEHPVVGCAHQAATHGLSDRGASPK